MDAVRPGPLTGTKVVELASEHAAFAGKLLGDLGAEVVLVEPPGGHHTRNFEPFLDDQPGPERSLWWWHYNTSKAGVTIDLDREPALFRRLVADADVVLEGEPPGRLAALGLDWPDVQGGAERMIWVSVTPFGRDNPRQDEQATDLTVLAGGGPVWNCGYDDHRIPPVRGGGNQGYQTASIWAVMGAMAALLHREVSGRGQHVDVSMHAAANVTTEAGSYEWLVARQTVQRQTGRHAAVHPTMEVAVTGSDGLPVTTGVPPRSPQEFRNVLSWLEELGIRDRFDDAPLLELAIERGGLSIADLMSDGVALEIFGAGREALAFIASTLSAYDFFVEAQRRGLACGAVYSPEDVMNDVHFQARGFPVSVHHDDLGRDVVYPGAPFIAHGSPWRITRRAPHLGEHDDEVLGQWRGAPRPDR